MKKEIIVKVPDIGDFENIPVIEILVTPGDEIKKEQSLLVLESDKATMEIPSPETGEIKEILVKTEDTVSMGDAIATMEVPDIKNETSLSTKIELKDDNHLPSSSELTSTKETLKRSDRENLYVEVLVLGSGPGGYTAAFRASDLGKEVLIVERHTNLGGVCLNVGCIPSKALLHVSKIITDTQDANDHGISFEKPNIDLSKLRSWKNETVQKLTNGLNSLAKKRNVKILEGDGVFLDSKTMKVETKEGTKIVSFEYAIIAAGSSPSTLPNLPEDPRIMNSTTALKIEDIPKSLLVIGGGIIGLEMASVYHALGSKITIAELTGGLIPEADRDLIKPFQRIIEKRYNSVQLGTKVVGIVPHPEYLSVTLKNQDTEKTLKFDRVLISIGRKPNSHSIGAEAAGIEQEHGYIKVDNQMRTNIPNIFAIGDIVGQPMLAHKASHEAKICAEVIAGNDKVTFDAVGIPSVAYTDPEIAWVGLTEDQAKKNNIRIKKTTFPWSASGRALTSARTEGLTKLIFDHQTKRLLGAGIVGINAGELISETTLGIELGIDSEDLSLTVHPHPTLSETVLFSAEISEESITDLYLGK